MGASQSGKTTFINGLANHILEVEFNDFYRYEIRAPETGEMSMYTGAKSRSDQLPTEWVSSYTFQGYHDRYTIIDTPGYGDTTQVEKDKELDAQMSSFLTKRVTKTNELRTLHLDALCFVVSAKCKNFPEYEKYVFERILSLFGKDVKDKVFLISTHASEDGSSFAYSANIQFFKHFKFENSCLYANNKSGEEIVKRRWEAAEQGYSGILEHVSGSNASPVALEQTKLVVEKRVRLEQIIYTLQEKVQEYLHHSANLAAEKEKLDVLKQKINSGVIESYETIVHIRERVNKEPGHNVTVCLVCEITCHEDCQIEQDKDKFDCWAMNSNQDAEIRQCCICEKRCHWKEHSNTPYYYRTISNTVTRCVRVRCNEYGISEQDVERSEKLVAAMERHVNQLLIDIHHCIQKRNRFMDELSEMAMKTVTSTTEEYIDNLIRKEEKEKNPGYEGRVQQLHKARQGPELLAKALSELQPQQ